MTRACRFFEPVGIFWEDLYFNFGPIPRCPQRPDTPPVVVVEAKACIDHEASLGTAADKREPAMGGRGLASGSPQPCGVSPRRSPDGLQEHRECSRPSDMASIENAAADRSQPTTQPPPVNQIPQPSPITVKEPPKTLPPKATQAQEPPASAQARPPRQVRDLHPNLQAMLRERYAPIPLPMWTTPPEGSEGASPDKQKEHGPMRFSISLPPNQGSPFGSGGGACSNLSALD